MAVTLDHKQLNYCVYFHIRKDTNKVFYIGKGWTSSRPYSQNNRNPYWHNIVNKAGYDTKIISKKLTNEQASKLEIRLIALYQKRNIGIVNLTAGGDGISGWKHTVETRKKISLAKKGKPVPSRVNLVQKNSKKVICNETGQIWNSLSLAALENNIPRSTLFTMLKFNFKHNRKCNRSFSWLSR